MTFGSDSSGFTENLKRFSLPNAPLVVNHKYTTLSKLDLIAMYKDFFQRAKQLSNGPGPSLLTHQISTVYGKAVKTTQLASSS